MDTNPLKFALRRVPWVTSLLLFTLPVFSQQYNSNNVTPPNSLTGKLNGAASGKQAGVDGNNHAILELGDAANSIDLHPAGGYYSSMAIATDGLRRTTGLHSDFLLRLSLEQRSGH